MWLKLVLLIVLFVFLALGTRWVVAAFDKLAEGLTSKGKLAIAAILVALSTSLPELFVAVASSLEGRPEISMGNLLGANVANLSLVVGGAAIATGTLPILGNYWRHELAAAFLAGMAPIVLLMDGGLSRLDGFILLVIYVIYLDELVIDGRKKSLAKEGVARPGIISKLMIWHQNGVDGSLLKLLLGVGVMMISADFLVKTAIDISSTLRIPGVILGLVIFAIGTTLPELSLSIVAGRKKKTALVLGNLLGSIVTNATLIVGILALIGPFQVRSVTNYNLVNIAFVLIFSVFWFFTKTKRKLERWEGAILIGLFLTFAGLELLFPSIANLL